MSKKNSVLPPEAQVLDEMLTKHMPSSSFKQLMSDLGVAHQIRSEVSRSGGVTPALE